MEPPARLPAEGGSFEVAEGESFKAAEGESLELAEGELPEPTDPAEPARAIRVEVRIADSVLDRCPIDSNVATQCVRAAAAVRSFFKGEISVLITDDPEIHQVNRDHLQHDYPTDVISFGYHAESQTIDGDLVVSVDTADAMAVRHGISRATELQLYLIHGTLHLGGMDDHDPADRLAMRTAEREVLRRLANPEADQLKVDGFPAVSDQVT